MHNPASLWYSKMMVDGQVDISLASFSKWKLFFHWCFFPKPQQEHIKTIFVLCGNQTDMQDKLDAQISKKDKENDNSFKSDVKIWQSTVSECKTKYEKINVNLKTLIMIKQVQN